VLSDNAFERTKVPLSYFVLWPPAAQLLRRAGDLPYSFPSDDELVRAADQVFQELDRREAKG